MNRYNVNSKMTKAVVNEQILNADLEGYSYMITVDE